MPGAADQGKVQVPRLLPYIQAMDTDQAPHARMKQPIAIASGKREAHMTTNIIYIAGSGRSGSTFLSQLLSQNADCFNVGQIRDLPSSYAKNLGCSCYKDLMECAFWSPVVSEFQALHGADALDKYAQGIIAFRNSSNKLSSWGDAETRDQIAADNIEFLDLASDLYRITSAQAGGATLVDSSKAPNIALGHILANDISVTVVHLMRDPRAVAASWAKLSNRPNVIRKRCKMWNKRTRQMQRLGNIPGQKIIHIKYEDFASAPKTAIKDIQEMAGVEQNAPYFDSDTSATLSWDRTHLFPPANGEVLGGHLEQIEIRPSETWKSEANKRYSDIAQKINFPLAKKYGYE